MRVLSIVLYALGGLALVIWCIAYVYLQGLGCAFSGPEGSKYCRIKWPFELRGEDFTFLVTIPGLIVAGLFLLAWLTRRAAKPQNRSS